MLLPVFMLCSLIVMGLDLVGPDLVFGGMTAIFAVSGIISVRDAAAGFSNTGVLTVVVLYLVAEGVSQTGCLDLAFNAILGRSHTVFWAQVYHQALSECALPSLQMMAVHCYSFGPDERAVGLIQLLVVLQVLLECVHELSLLCCLASSLVRLISCVHCTAAIT
eukprot:GHRR01034729.1.p1 GENE.GHRR01034729.1~~GHRR01034729.1.p1  ORF type:complete len:164 (-),score=29.62 GHRR01034729.1:217-708(-)